MLLDQDPDRKRPCEEEKHLKQLLSEEETAARPV